jgi:hypothetical protein
MNIQKIKEVKQLLLDNDVNQYLKDGWVLLNVSVTAKGIAYVLGRY